MTTSSGEAWIEFGGRRLRAAAGETVLEALLRQGAAVAHSCRRGTCHTCVLHCEEGEVSHDRAVDAAIVDSGHIVPCIARASGAVRLGPPQLDRLATAGELVSRRALGGGVFEIGIAPLKTFAFEGGQHLRVSRADGLARSYSIASLPEDDFFFTLHVRHIAGGAMSEWLCAEAPLGERVHLLAAQGGCRYDASMADRRLLLLATGAGAGALAAVARAALAAGHAAGITLYHGVREPAELYLHDLLSALAARHPGFRYVPCVSRPRAGAALPEGVLAGRVTAAAFGAGEDLAGAELFLCGAPAMVEDARCLGVGAGIARARIHADPFEHGAAPEPRDAAKIAAIAPDAELWDALERGPRLTRILDAFYRRVYADERLSPFFDGLPREQVVAKQYAFLADLFSGSRNYFGLNPYNAHHWMVISDELFDHREALFEQALREDGLPERLVRRWAALHERFRAEIVKPVARGLRVRGEEHPVRVHAVGTLDIDAVCDGCGAEIKAGQPSRYQYRLGTLHCARCAGLD